VAYTQINIEEKIKLELKELQKKYSVTINDLIKLMIDKLKEVEE